MGGCASKPKDLDTKEAPAPETPADQNVQVDAVPQENKDGDETTKEEPLVDVSEPEPEPGPESEKTEEKPAAEAVDEEPPKEEPKAEDSAPVVKV